MELPDEDFLTVEDREVLTTAADNVQVIATLFSEASATTEGLRMAAAAFRVGAERLELIAERMEATA